MSVPKWERAGNLPAAQWVIDAITHGADVAAAERENAELRAKLSEAKLYINLLEAEAALTDIKGETSK